jgi:glutamate racemase
MVVKARQGTDILLFDSGLGGLSILAELRKQLPALRYTYLADNAGLPYGNKADDWLLQRISLILSSFTTVMEPRVLVLACNTASTLVLPVLRSRFAFPIVGVVPAIKPAAGQSQKRVIGLLATPATVNRPYTDSLIQEFAHDCQVIRVGSSELVEWAEEKLRGGRPSTEKLQRICAPFLEAKDTPDVIVLGCTHFPFLRDELSRILPNVTWLDSGAAVAKRVKDVLALHLSFVDALQKLPIDRFFLTTPDPGLASVVDDFGFSVLDVWTLPPAPARL